MIHGLSIVTGGAVIVESVIASECHKGWRLDWGNSNCHARGVNPPTRRPRRQTLTVADGP